MVDISTTLLGSITDNTTHAHSSLSQDLSHKRNTHSNGIHVLSIYFWPRVYIHCMFTIRVRVRLSVRVRARDSFKLIMNFACATKHLIGLLPLDVL